MKTYQLVDLDGENFGLIKTNFQSDIIKKEFEEYYNSDTEELGPEEFIEKLSEKYPNDIFERFFIDEIIAP